MLFEYHRWYIDTVDYRGWTPSATAIIRTRRHSHPALRYLPVNCPSLTPPPTPLLLHLFSPGDTPTVCWTSSPTWRSRLKRSLLPRTHASGGDTGGRFPQRVACLLKWIRYLPSCYRRAFFFFLFFCLRASPSSCQSALFLIFWASSLSSPSVFGLALLLLAGWLLRVSV